MTTSDENVSDDELKPAAAKRIREALKEEPKWKKILLIAAGVCLVLGFLLWAFESGGTGDSGLRKQAGAGGVPGAGSGGASFTGSGGVTLPSDNGVLSGEDEGAPWAPIFLRFGFSFFIGYALGAAARTVFKLVLLFVGLFAALLFGFAELQFVEVHWDTMGAAFDGFVSKIGEESGSLKGFFTGRLPSAGLALLGLYAGFKRG